MPATKLKLLARTLLPAPAAIGATGFHRVASIAVGLMIALVSTTALAFPPAPHHVLYGMVRNQWGDPINVSAAEIVFETASASVLATDLIPIVEPGMNYRLTVPMDTGTTLDLYKPTAIRQTMPFRIRVKVGATVYLPIEMAGTLSQIGKPAQATRLDLTLGEDLDGDGLPDAWEQALIALYGGTLATINPNDDTDGDGISNRNEYLAGTYAFDPTEGFRLAVVEMNTANSLLEFLVLRGRTYTIQTSTDLRQWTPASFRVVTAGQPGSPRNSYLSTDVRLLQVEVPAQVGSQTNQYFRALVQ